MPTRQLIDDFLAQRHLAFVGVSRNPRSFANSVYRELRSQGRTMYPVNSSGDLEVLEGDTSYRSLQDVPDPVDGVVVMVPEDSAAQVVKAAIARGIPRVWLYHGIGPGSVSPEAVELCRSHGVDVVDGACPFMFDGEVTGIHHLHRMLSGRRIAREATHAPA